MVEIDPNYFPIYFYGRINKFVLIIYIFGSLRVTINNNINNNMIIWYLVFLVQSIELGNKMI